MEYKSELWFACPPIAEYNELPDGYKQVKSIWDFLIFKPHSADYYEMKQGKFILKDDTYVEYDIKDGLRDFHVTDYIKENKCYIKTN